MVFIRLDTVQPSIARYTPSRSIQHFDINEVLYMVREVGSDVAVDQIMRCLLLVTAVGFYFTRTMPNALYAALIKRSTVQ